VKSTGLSLRQPEDASRDDGPLDLRRAAADRRRQRDEEALPPAAFLIGQLRIVDGAERSEQVGAQLEQLLAQLARGQLHVAVLGRRAALGKRGEPLVAEGTQAGAALVARGQSPPHDGIALEAVAPRELDEAVEGALAARHRLDPQPAALVGERAHRDAPAVVERAHEVGARHDHVVE
jgi:hypothetical protein